ncbi:hypothetical protein [Sphaerotilus sp.]|jgi:hypothetical protein|uniref:hypothetical protein n=1 Tax=Sphaerotilus sp. TaxID=2093942 RepID=UPI0025D90563|nr:hypothetical protein [Sphaerotilus sp.]
MKPIGWLVGVGSVLVLMACGGGGSAQSSAGVVEPAVPVRISGVVARGAALVEAKVLARCGSGPLVSATSGSSGAYTLEVEASALPCVLQAVSADGIWTLHSVARGGADTPAVTAHITTLTELLVAQLAGTAPSVFMAQATARTLGATVTPANIAKAQVSVAGVLQRMGVNPAPISDVLGQPLVAASAVQRGNAHDKVLDALAESMRSSGAKLADLIALVGSRARTL